MVVIACHIPFIFFSGKEGLLIIIDELDRKSISQTLEERIKNMNLQAKYDQQDTDTVNKGRSSSETQALDKSDKLNES